MDSITRNKVKKKIVDERLSLYGYDYLVTGRKYKPITLFIGEIKTEFGLTIQDCLDIISEIIYDDSSLLKEKYNKLEDLSHLISLLSKLPVRCPVDKFPRDLFIEITEETLQLIGNPEDVSKKPPLSQVVFDLMTYGGNIISFVGDKTYTKGITDILSKLAAYLPEEQASKMTIQSNGFYQQNPRNKYSFANKIFVGLPTIFFLFHFYFSLQ